MNDEEKQAQVRFDNLVNSIPSGNFLIVSCPMADAKEKWVDILKYCPNCPHFGSYGEFPEIEGKSLGRKIFLQCNYRRHIGPSLLKTNFGVNNGSTE